MPEKNYRIGEAAELLNLKTHVLRFWETEFPQLAPLRTDKGQRLYTESHLALLRRIRQLLHEQGMTIEGARRVLEGSAVLDENGNPYDLYSLLSVAKLSDGDIPNDAIAVNTRLSDNNAQSVKEAFLKMASDEKGLEIMGAWNHSGYIEANEADYDTIAQYIELATE